MAQEPQLRRGSAPSNLYVNRWRWWYSAISDAMLANPNATQTDIAKLLDKNHNTVSMIVNTDLFRDYHAQRKREFQEANDFMLSNKLNKVAEKGLDLLLEVMNKKGDQVPLSQLVAITGSALENLGYGAPQAPGVSLNIQNNNNPQVVVPVSAGALSEARDALRLAEAKRRDTPVLERIGPPLPEVEQLLEEEGASAPIPLEQ